MATIATVAEVLEIVETDLSDAVIQRYLNAAEEDVREYLTSGQLKTIPTVLWEGSYTPTLGEDDGQIKLTSSVKSHEIARFEGTVAYNSRRPTFSADTRELEEDESGEDTVTPVTTGQGTTAASASGDGYAFRSAPALTPADIDTQTEVPTTGNGYELSILPRTHIDDPIVGNMEFVSDYSGTLHVDGSFSSNNTQLEVDLVFRHEYQDGDETITFDSVRTVSYRVNNREDLTIPLNVFNSRTVVPVGAYELPDGRTLTFTQEILNSGVYITILMRLRFYVQGEGSPDGTRKQGNIEHLNFQRPNVVYYQIGVPPTPVVADDVEVEGGAFDVSVDSTGKVLTIDTSDTTSALTFTKVLGLSQKTAPAHIVQAVIDLVQLAVLQRGIESERVGQYSVKLADYAKERGKVLGRLVYASDESLVL